MELRQLRYFLAVARTLNFTKAAAEVHIAQPPLSRQVAKLEAELGVSLFHRNPRGLKLTAAGALLVERASEILMRVERTKRDVAAFNAKRRRLFKIGFDLPLLYGRSPRIFRYLRENHSEYEFEYVEVASVDQPRALRNGEIDLALGLTLLVDDQVEQIIVRNESLMLALPTGHPAFRGAGQPVRLADFRSETLILYEEQVSPGSQDPVLRFIEHVGFTPADTMTIRGLAAALGLAAAGIGFSIVPARALLMRSQDICFAPLAEDGATSPVVLSTLRGTNGPMVAGILAEVKRLTEADLT
ncbi:LysR family transcriptional regulator [Roseixanthobacter liquoris]|uniref:LysR family transcriptional regulator n=1 Tax=Roseixanthobacter liquoris TaxID=3119921 RepID=UPI00372660A2